MKFWNWLDKLLMPKDSHLFDVVEYNNCCVRWSSKGIPILPPPAPWEGPYNEREYDQMQDSLDAARAIYEYYTDKG